MWNAARKVLRIVIFLAFSLSFIFSYSASGTSSGSASPPFIFDGIVRSMDKHQGNVGSRYDVESSDWHMTFQVSVMPGYGDVDDSINVGDRVQVCGERGTGINQTLVNLIKPNHYIRRTGLAAAPKQQDTSVRPGQTGTDATPVTQATESADASGTQWMGGCINSCESACRKACTPVLKTR